jgi:hypothetical protein
MTERKYDAVVIGTRDCLCTRDNSFTGPTIAADGARSPKAFIVLICKWPFLVERCRDAPGILGYFGSPYAGLTKEVSAY